MAAPSDVDDLLGIDSNGIAWACLCGGALRFTSFPVSLVEL